jgi:transcriptional regulator
VVISKQEQIQQRRNRVWELYSQGLTQEEIAAQLEPFHVSRRMVGYDLEWLKKESIADFLSDNRKKIAEEYKKAMSNFEQLRAEAWKHFRQAKNESNIKVALYDTIQSINNNILILLSVGDMIEMELKIKTANENAKEIREEMDKALELEAKF